MEKWKIVKMYDRGETQTAISQIYRVWQPFMTL